MGKPSFHMQEPDPALLRQAQERTPDNKPTPGAWQALLELRATYGDRLLNFVYRLTGDEAAAQDIIEKFFFERLGTALRTKSSDLPFIPWLVTSVQREGFKDWRYRQHVRPLENESGEEERAQPPEERALMMGRLEKEEDVDARDLIERAKQELTEHERQAFYLHHELGLTAKEVAEILGIKPANAAQLFWRATAKFRNVYLSIESENALTRNQKAGGKESDEHARRRADTP